ncbi:MAG TPA: hypothetical protein VJH97_03575 [Candidatus Nanoarchaeia archaeon]|nr:hypothetical protein [Candidatus Nanoarchaeia archaeon]
MSAVFSIVLFFVYMWGLGFTALYNLKKPENIFERHLMYVAIGLGIFPILSILLNFLHIPLDWRIFLLVSVAFPIYCLVRNHKSIKFTPVNLTKSNLTLLFALVIFFISLFVYSNGSFTYPYLEDSDPWDHAVGIKYVALEKTAYDPDVTHPDYAIDPVISYMDPYPPAYDILLGVLHQTHLDVIWVMKFFNSLIISLGILFFYLFAKKFMGSSGKALFATAVLAAIPSYLSHFIWAHSLVVTLVFPLMFAFESIEEDKKWWYIAALIFGSIWVTQNIEQPTKITTLLVIYIIVNSIVTRKFQKHATIAAVSGLLLSFLWWGAMLLKYKTSAFIAYYGGDTGSAEIASQVGSSSLSFIGKVITVIPRFFDPGGSASRAYLFRDFFQAPLNNMINNPIGIGIVLTLLVFLSIVWILLKNKASIIQNRWLTVSLFWLVFTFLGVNGETFNLNIARGAFRVWMLMAIPLSLIAAEGFSLLYDKASKMNKLFGSALLLVILFGIFQTSFIPKYSTNNAIWPTAGSFQGGPQEASQYAQWFATLEPNTKVYFYSNRDKLALGFNAYSCLWCQNVIDFRQDILSHNVTELYTFLKENDYEYLLLGRMDYLYLATDENSTALLDRRIQEISNSGLFRPAYQVDQVMVALRIL